MYTSGTTGKPKGVLQGHRFLLGHNGVDYAFNFLREDDVYYSPADWAWAGGLMLGLLLPMAHGIPLVAYRATHFDPEHALAIMERHGVSVGLFPPTVLRLIRDSGAARPEVVDRLRLRCFVSGAEAVTPEVIAWAQDRLRVAINNAYGQTEANGLVGHCSALESMDPEALGRPYPGHAVAIVNDALEPVGPGEMGQIAVRADDPACMLEYWRNPTATGEKVSGGWLLTGDSAHYDGDGLLYFHGRADDIIKSSGYRIGPAEIESALLEHEAVAECAAIGKPDPVRGQVVAAYVRLRDGATPSEGLTAALQRLVRERVGAHAYPREVHYVESLPRTETGKIRREQLKELARESGA
jgi:acetyl-CoA synthetase